MPGSDNTTKTDRAFLLKLWAAVFLYASVISFFVQCILLRFIVPGWNGGDGLLIGSYDSQVFHYIATNLANRMHFQGVSVWQLRPDGHPVAGIAAYIYYLMNISKPWTLIPLNAVGHATATVILFMIFRQFLNNNKRALLTVLPFWLYLSAAIWYSQIHKDGYFILGSYMFLFGWLVFIKLNNKGFMNRLTASASLILLGVFLIWVMRPYFVELFIVVDIIFAIIAVFVLFHGTRIYAISRSKAAVSFLTICAVIAINTLFTQDHPLSWLLGTAESAWKITIKYRTPGTNSLFSQTWAYPRVNMPVTEPAEPSVDSALNENRSIVMPRTSSKNKISLAVKYFNTELDKLISRRRAFLIVSGRSNIDEDLGFDHRNEALLYFFTRGIQISLFAPFPNEWFKEGSCEANTAMRRIAIVEMLGIYFALFFLPFAVWFWRKRIEVFMILIFALFFLSILGFVICNIGTLYRIRYGFIMLLVALGIARASLFLKDSH